MTKRPRLVPGHKHDWKPNLVGTLATCTICELSMPIAVVHLDQPTHAWSDANPEHFTRGLVRCQRCGAVTTRAQADPGYCAQPNLDQPHNASPNA